MIQRVSRIYDDIEKYLANHIDFILGVCSIGTGWSVIAGPERGRFNYAFLGDSLVPGVFLLTAGCILVLISLTDRPWKDIYFLWMTPSILYVWHISREIWTDTTSPGPNGIIFLMAGLLIIAYISVKRKIVMDR